MNMMNMTEFEEHENLQLCVTCHFAHYNHVAMLAWQVSSPIRILCEAHKGELLTLIVRP